MRLGSRVSWGLGIPFSNPTRYRDPPAHRQPALHWSRPRHPLGWLLTLLAIAGVMTKTGAQQNGYRPHFPNTPSWGVFIRPDRRSPGATICANSGRPPVAPTAGSGDPRRALSGDPRSSAVGRPAPSAVGRPAPSAVGRPAPSAVGRPAPSAVGRPVPSAVGRRAPSAVGIGGPAPSASLNSIAPRLRTQKRPFSAHLPALARFATDRHLTRLSEIRTRDSSAESLRRLARR